jgi:carboxyl-terminal processing protease
METMRLSPLVAAFVLLAAIGAGTTPPPRVQETLARILAHAESASVYRDRVDWPATRAEVERLADTATTIPGLGPALRYLLKTMGDEHARVIHGGRPIAFHFGAPKPHLAGFDRELNTRIQSAAAFPFRAELIHRNVGYVRIVGLPMGDNTAMAKQIDDAVCRVHRKGATRWILDLRYNGGGNLNPMAEGVAAIIGDGPAGGNRGLTRREDGEWRITDGAFVNEGYAIRLRRACRMPLARRVAVLTSQYTASSGEALAVMFKGRPNTHFFGSKTLGMVTVTDWLVLDDSTTMTISVGHYADRTGHVYDQFVDVHEAVTFTPTEVLTSDAAVERAVEWLRRL